MTKTRKRTTPPQFTIRPAGPQDKQSVLSFTKNTFGENGDYIAHIWDRWLKDRDGYFWVAEYRGRAVGTAKLTFHSPDEAWMEGLRVNPRHRGKGIARALHQVCVEAAAARGVRVVRLATHSQNKPIHRIAAEFGFQLTCGFAYYVAAPQAGEARSPFTMGPDLWSPARGAIWGSGFFKASRGMYARHTISWVWKELTEERLKEHLNQGEVVAYLGPGGAVDALAIVTRLSGEESLWVSYLDGKPAAVQELALALRSKEVEGMFPEPSPVVPILEEIGYERGFEGQMWLFEKRFTGEGGRDG